ncbi:DUF1917-domain-containing protein [Coniochaeta ligniaria NRRL 30616]|uniref:DUF1917-domain-containing protein n=1 Tax=Coniochaeta ligniaria NRRL 30616 TaxID=1408157 RepID=A0A1J7JAL6_9PEZI|nr:DUF1917-domain-containing protein [Coniochaeta ligniaria NRRL 30616]
MDSDSDFYGMEETISHLNTRVSSLDTSTALRDLMLTIPFHPRKQVTAHTKIGHLHNPYEGVRYARQLDETVDAFLARLPPSTTRVTATDFWIYICNPFIPREPKSQSANQHVSGCEDEAPLESDTKLGRFIQGGMDRLHLLSDFISKTKSMARTKNIATREINKERALAVTQILDLAHHLHVRCGKWMLFPEPNAVDGIWAVVARATAANELGVAAKVAPKGDEEGRQGSARLICVYTRDFRDKDDVGRVLGRLRELELGIGSKNAWDIRASLVGKCGSCHGCVAD